MSEPGRRNDAAVAALDFVDICPNLKRRLSLIECAEQRDEQQKKKEAVESGSFAANGESNGPNFRK
jgi:hypothetical protein